MIWGSIGGILEPLFGGFPCILMSPLTFLKNPYLWLKAITEYKATASGGPNFAYDYCVKKITPAQRETLNLSSWEVAFNGAEPIHGDTLDRFYNLFKECGFRKEAFFPCYGLAEATLLVSCANHLKGYETCYLSETELQNNHVSICDSQDLDAHPLVNCGVVNQETIIVNASTEKRCEENEVGEVWVRGSSVARGYWGKPKETKEIFDAHLADEPTNKGYLRTGDLGFLKGEDLYITGRIKDLMIIHGRNHYPQDIEFTVGQAHAHVRRGGIAVFSITVSNEEHVAIVAEIESLKEPSGADYEQICEAIVKAVEEEHELAIHTIALIAPRSLPKTTSGKIRRQYTKEILLQQQLVTYYLWTPEKALHSAEHPRVLPQPIQKKS